MQNKEYKLPEVLKELIERDNINQSILSRELKVTQSAIYRWLYFERTPDMFHLMQLAEYFNVSIDYLVFGDKGE